MSDQRIKGQEVSLNVVRDGQVEDTITAIQDFEATDLLSVISKGYLGEPTDRKDMIYKGVKFSFKLHIFRQDYFALRQAIIDIAQRKTPDSQVTLTGVLFMANGDTPDFTIPNAQFGELPMKVPSRDEYVDITLQGEAPSMVCTLS